MRVITRRRGKLFSGTQGNRLVGMVAELEALESFSRMSQATLRAIVVVCCCCWQDRCLLKDITSSCSD